MRLLELLLTIGVFAGIFLPSALHVSAFAADEQISIADDREIDRILASVSPELAERRRQQRRAQIPVLIIIPGILGSKIVDEETGTVLWGTVGFRPGGSGPTLAYPSKGEVTADLLDEFRLDIPLLDRGLDVYGEAVRRLAQLYLSDEHFLNVFPYDWRQDNRLSASQFHEWICSKPDTFSGRNVVIIAHSMGGLITKYWLKHFHETARPCADGTQRPEITSLHVVFVGVPHYGAPQALKAFSQGYRLLSSGKDSFPGLLLDAFDQRYLVRALNEFGYTFPSTYQLLPIYHEDCFADHAQVPPDPLPRPFAREVQPDMPSSIDDIFSATFWKAMGWPREKGESFDETQYYGQKLQAHLDNAFDFLCEIAAYRIPATVRVTYFASNAHSTDAAYKVPFDGSALSVTARPGDGTVPYPIAANQYIPTGHLAHQVDRSLTHGYMLRSQELWTLISDWMTLASMEAEREAIRNEEDRAVLQSAYVRARAIPIHPLVEEISPDDREYLQRFTSNVLTDLGFTPRDAYRVARDSPDQLFKGTVYSYVLNTAGPSDGRLGADAGNRLVHLQIQSHLWGAAAQTAEAVKESDSWNALSEGERQQIGKYLYNNEGWARLELGDLEQAQGAFVQAQEFGNPKAEWGIDELSVRQTLQDRFLPN